MAADVRFAVIGADWVRAYFTTAPAAIAVKSKALVKHYGQLLLTRIKSNASGRPGPEAITGDYRRSWVMKIASRGGIYTAYVGTNAPQGRRLEFGFNGVDSLGRTYNQPPYPHVHPATEAIIPEFVDAMKELVDDPL